MNTAKDSKNPHQRNVTPSFLKYKRNHKLTQERVPASHYTLKNRAWRRNSRPSVVVPKPVALVLMSMRRGFSISAK